MIISNKKINENLKKFIFIIFFYFFSLILLKYYTFGDQQFYTKMYEAFKSTSLDNLMEVYYINTRGTEPISAILLWIGANLGIDKNIYISFWNTVLIFGFLLIFKRYNVPWYITFLLIFNFYIIVLFTGAERLKFCYILIIFGLLSEGKTRSILILLSPLAHLQGLLFLTSLILIRYQENLINFFSNFIIKKNNIKYFFFLIIVTSIFFYFIESKIIYKLKFYMIYSENFLLRDVLKVLIIFLISLIITKRYFLMTVATFPLFIAIFFVGGFRINMILLSIYVYIFLAENKIKHPLSIAIILYFFIKSIFFIKNIFIYNDGFKGFLL